MMSKSLHPDTGRRGLGLGKDGGAALWGRRHRLLEQQMLVGAQHLQGELDLMVHHHHTKTRKREEKKRRDPQKTPKKGGTPRAKAHMKEINIM